MCLKIPHRVQTYCLFAFLLSAFFCAFGISQESFATSYTCSSSGSPNSQKVSNLAFSSICLDGDGNYFSGSGAFHSSSPWYYYFVSGEFTFLNQGSSNLNPYLRIANTNNSLSNVPMNYYGIFKFLISSNGSRTISILPINQYMSLSNYYNDSSTSSSFYFNTNISFMSSNTNVVISSYSISFVITDEPPSSSEECEECQVCPEVPENPYDDKLDDIKKAIYACGATLIMLYFFFCIYKIIVKDGGKSR